MRPEHFLWVKEWQGKQGSALAILSVWIFRVHIGQTLVNSLDFSNFLVCFSSLLSRSSFFRSVSLISRKGAQRQSVQNQGGEPRSELNLLYWESEILVHLR